MDARYVYIFDAGEASDLGEFANAGDESKHVCRGLFLKHQQKASCEGVTVLVVDQGGGVQPHPKQQHGTLPGATGAAAALPAAAIPAAADTVAVVAQEKKGEKHGSGGAPPRPRTIGAYFVMHGPAGFALPIDRVVKAIQAGVPAEQLSQIHYVVLLSCALVDKKKEKQAIDNGFIDMNREDAGYIVGFMKALTAAGIRPVVAGWDTYISAAPHRPKDQPLLRPLARKGAYEEIADVDAIAGRKYMRQPSGQRYITLNNEYRKLHKHLYTATGDGRLKVQLGRWSDLSQG